MVDTHMHSHALRKQGINPEELLRNLAQSGFKAIIDVAITPNDTLQPLEVEDTALDIYHTCGIHPSHSGDADTEEMLDTLSAILNGTHPEAPRIAAIGETGLDWFREYAPRKRQKELFAFHLSAAKEFTLPVIVHNREADDDCFHMIRENTLPRGGIVHCFSSEPVWVKRFVDLGMYISFAGNVTYKRNHTLREAAALVPIDRILIETDAPYLAPHPRRGRVNHPGLIGYTYDVVAQTRNMPVEDLVNAVATNTEAVFGLQTQ
jgi:TatD DNase family protein